MSRVLLTGGAGAIGAAIARRLLADPRYDVRVFDDRPTPLWMREGCEIRDGDLRSPVEAHTATNGCPVVVHLATHAPSGVAADAQPYTVIEHENAIHAAVVGAAVEQGVERLVYVSSAAVIERAEQLPTPEAEIRDCPMPRSPRAFARLSGERYCLAAREQHGLPVTICRPSAVYGAVASAGGAPRALPAAGEPGVESLIGELLAATLAGERSFELIGTPARTLTPTHVEDVADGIVLALSSPAALNEDFNLAGPRELTLAELARLAGDAAGADPAALELKAGAADDEDDPADPPRSWPSAQKALDVLGWEAHVTFEDGLARTARSLTQASDGRIGVPI
jgi:nucleoside-diphosphate-sugar epimerase